MPTLDALPLFDFMLRTSNATFASFITQKRQKTWDKKKPKKSIKPLLIHQMLPSQIYQQLAGIPPLVFSKLADKKIPMYNKKVAVLFFSSAYVNAQFHS